MQGEFTERYKPENNTLVHNFMANTFKWEKILTTSGFSWCLARNIYKDPQFLEGFWNPYAETQALLRYF